MNMNEKLPPHLQSTLQLVERAYPLGVPKDDYLSLLAVLSEYMCEENLSIVAAFWNESDGSRTNDVLAAKQQLLPTDSVVDRLRAAGFEQWIAEENE